MAVTNRSAGVLEATLLVALTAFLLGCAAPAATPNIPRDRDAVTIQNETDAPVTIAYQAPDGGRETVADLGPGERIVVPELFAGREGLCRAGRLVALAGDGAQVDQMYTVCQGAIWAVGAS